MKTFKKTNRILTAMLLFITVCSFTYGQENTAKELIHGTWAFSDSPNTKWQFKEDGKCYDYLEDVLLDTYTYTITEEISTNGDPNETILRLVNINNPEETYVYSINKLNSGKLWLEYQFGFRDKYISFTKQDKSAVSSR